MKLHTVPTLVVSTLAMVLHSQLNATVSVSTVEAKLAADRTTATPLNAVQDALADTVENPTVATTHSAGDPELTEDAKKASDSEDTVDSGKTEDAKKVEEHRNSLSNKSGPDLLDILFRVDVKPEEEDESKHCGSSEPVEREQSTVASNAGSAKAAEAQEGETIVQSKKTAESASSTLHEDKSAATASERALEEGQRVTQSDNISTSNISSETDLSGTGRKPGDESIVEAAPADSGSSSRTITATRPSSETEEKGSGNSPLNSERQPATVTRRRQSLTMASFSSAPENDSVADLRAWNERNLKLLEKAKGTTIQSARIGQKQKLLRALFNSLFWSWSGTLLQYTLTSATFWLVASIFIGMRLGLQYGCMTAMELPALTVDNINSALGLLMFFLIFYVNQAYTRFMAQYNICMCVVTRILDLVSAASVYIPASAKRIAMDLHGVHALAIYGVSKTYSRDNFLMAFSPKVHNKLDANGHLNSNRLFTREEWTEIEDYDENVITDTYFHPKYQRVLTEIAKAPLCEFVAESAARESRDRTMPQLAFQLREQLGTFYDYEQMPISFAYVQFIEFATKIFLPLYAYALAIQDIVEADLDHHTPIWQYLCRFPKTNFTTDASDPHKCYSGGKDYFTKPSDGRNALNCSFALGPVFFNFVLLMFMTIFVVGLCELGTQLSDPFGTDVSDLAFFQMN